MKVCNWKRKDLRRISLFGEADT